MSDTISRQEAINALGEKPFAGAGDKYDYEQGLQNQWERDVIAIKILPSAQQWIPVSERLPEKSGRYLVTRGLNACGALWNRVYFINYSDLMGLKSERIWWDGNVGKSDFERIDDVIAWMPLPKPWKGDTDE